MSKTKVSITLDAELVVYIDEVCVRDGRKRSEQIERMCVHAREMAILQNPGGFMRISAPLPVIIDCFRGMRCLDPSKMSEVILRVDPAGGVVAGEDLVLSERLWKQQEAERERIESE